MFSANNGDVNLSMPEGSDSNDGSNVSDDENLEANSLASISAASLTSKNPSRNVMLTSLPVSVKDSCAMVASGNTFGVALKEDGSVWTWGYNNYGQRGNGVIESVSSGIPTRVIGIDGEGYLENIKQISAGAHFVMALTNDGKVVTWGYNGYGQLGNNSTTTSSTPVYVVDVDGNQIQNIKQVSAGSSHAMALCEDGTAYSWGLNNYGQLGINVGNTTASNASYKRIYAVKIQKNTEDGLVDLNNIKQLSGGTDFSSALLEDGTVFNWGLGTSAQIGNGASNTVYIPTKVSNLTDVVKIDAGGLQEIALKSDGTIWTWGINRYGNLGIGVANTTSSNANYRRTTPVQVLKAASTPLTDIADISSLYETTYAVTTDGVVYAWGLNTSGQMADTTLANKSYATRVVGAGLEPIDNIVKLADGQHTNTNFMIDSAGYLYGSGVTANLQLMPERTAVTSIAVKLDETFMKLDNNQKYVETGSTIKFTPSYYNGFNVMNYAQSIGNITYSVQADSGATIDSDGTFHAGNIGRYTVKAIDNDSGYVAEAIVNVVSKDAIAYPVISAGTTFASILKEDGTVWTTGGTAATAYELGNGSRTYTDIPVQVKIDNNTFLTDIVKIDSGVQFTVALRNDGTVWAWGINGAGQLGNGTANTSYYAVQVMSPDGEGFLENVVDITAGLDQALALLDDGTVYGWGSGANHALGVNATGNKVLPAKMHDVRNAIEVDSGSDVTAVLKTDGTVWMTGYNKEGEMGDSTVVTPRAELVGVTNTDKTGALKDVARIETGNAHTIAIKNDGTAVAWGLGTSGQLGRGANSNSAFPIEIAINDGTTWNKIEHIRDVATGPASTYVLTSDGNVYVTGLNTTGELSIGNATNVNKFNILKDGDKNELQGVKSISNVSGTTFGVVLQDGRVGITGGGTLGQHGNRTRVNSNLITIIDNGNFDAGNLYEINVNETAKINVTGVPSFNVNVNASLSTDIINYESLDTSIATVSDDGTITGVSNGTTGIRIYNDSAEGVAQVIVGKRDFSNISKVVAGTDFAILLKDDGTVWTWGDNVASQLGNGSIGGKVIDEAVQVKGVYGEGYLTDVCDIAAGDKHVVALRKNGEVVAWGDNTYGQVGVGTYTADCPIYVTDWNGNKLTGVVDIGAARDHSAAVKADGSVWTWGRNDYQQLGDKTKINSNYALKVVNTASTGYLDNIKEVSVGGAYVAALTKDGDVYSWGLGTSGQIGNNAKSSVIVPTKAVGVENITKMVTGHHYTMVLKDDGTVWTWGLNRYGQLGYGSSSTSSSNGNYSKATPMQVKIDSTTFLTDVVDIGAILESGYAVTRDGTVYAWGLNTEAQLGDDTKTNRAYATKMVRKNGQEFDDEIVKVMKDSANAYTGLMIRKDGSILATGRATSGQLLNGMTAYASFTYVDDVDSSYMEFENRIEYIKNGQSKKLNLQTVENLNAKAVAPSIGNVTYKSTNEDVAVVDLNGNITAKKEGETTIIATEDLNGYRAETRIYVINSKDNSITTPMVVQGTSFTGILKADGTVWMTGINTNGQLGDGTTGYKGNVVQVKIDDENCLTGVLRISAGTSHMLAVTKDGEVYAWGLNDVGQLGQNNTVQSPYAVKVLDETGESSLKNIIDISAGAKHSFAIAKNGDVYAWGAGANYKLGDYGTANRLIPAKLTDTYNVVKVGCGTEYTILLRGDGIAQGTGLNTNGWLAMGDTTTRTTPIEIGNSTEKIIYRDVYDIAVGGNHTVLLREDGKAYACGLNTSGQLSQGNVTQYTIPEPMKKNTDNGERN